MAMTGASLALQIAIVTALRASPPLAAILGVPPRVYDHVPPGTPFPYVTIAQTLERDWSTGSDIGHEHTVTLHVWSRTAGRRQAHDIATILSSTLHDVALVLHGHRLVQMRRELTEIRREPDGETWRGIVRLRAVTEPL
jgi:hypothetical protein